MDERAYRQLIRHCLPHVNGVVTSGTTGEFNTLGRLEQKRLVEIAGCGASGTAQAIALAEDAKAVGTGGSFTVPCDRMRYSCIPRI